MCGLLRELIDEVLYGLPEDSKESVRNFGGCLESCPDMLDAHQASNNKSSLTRARTGMTEQEALELLRKHNRWRRGDNSIEMADPRAIGLAIDVACRARRTHTRKGEKPMTVLIDHNAKAAEYDPLGGYYRKRPDSVEAGRAALRVPTHSQRVP